MHIIDDKKFQLALKKKGYRSIGELAKSIGVHRNSIHHYLSGHGVFPECLEKIICALQLKPSDILIEKTPETLQSIEPIVPLVDKLHAKFPDVTFVLFGSRTGDSWQKYSDWDIGAFSKEDLPHDLYKQILRFTDDFAENLPFFIELVNLNRAENYFLRNACRNWIFLSGKLSDWLELKRRAVP